MVTVSGLRKAGPAVPGAQARLLGVRPVHLQETEVLAEPLWWAG